MQLFDQQLMKLLTFLTRRQAWLSPPEISNEFRLDGNRISARTVHRWFSFLRENGGFVYYPYPRANVLGLSDILVTVQGLRNPAVLGILPFAASFNVEVRLDNGEPFVRQGFWVPATAEKEFQEFWSTAHDLGLLKGVDLYTSRNTHFIFSPFESMTTEDGSAVWTHPADNSHFAKLILQDFHDRFEVRVSELLSEAPLIIPLVVERIWEFYSSRQVWEAIGQKGVARVWKYVKGLRDRDLGKPGAALHILQEQWNHLMHHFDEVFVQPRVFFNWPSLRNSAFLTVMMRASSSEAMLKGVMRMAERSIYTSLKPSIDLDGWCHVNCFLPGDQLAPIARIVGEYHSGTTPPLLTVQDRNATLELFHPSFCKLDWSLFNPDNLTWTFDQDYYLERLKNLEPQIFTQSPIQKPA